MFLDEAFGPSHDLTAFGRPIVPDHGKECVRFQDAADFWLGELGVSPVEGLRRYGPTLGLIW